jgi:uncharacterized protein (UPF0548 family)
VFRLTATSRADLQSLLDRARTSRPTYESTGATKGSLPDGYRHDRHEQALEGPDAFDRAKLGLTRWQAHGGAGVRVFPGGPVADGDTVLVLLRFGPLQVIAPCRVVYVIDEPDRFGLAYGTLPGHPEVGEESFVVERDTDGTGAMFRITAFSRPAGFLPRLAAPVTRALQLRVGRRYADAMRRFVEDVSP